MKKGGDMICPNCTHGFNWPSLLKTGANEPHPEYYCCVCQKQFYVDKGVLTEERPFAWPKKKPGVLGNSGGQK
jgi:hypothetical protein